MTEVDLAVTVMDQGSASVNRVIDWNTGCIACLESNVVLTLSRGREDAEPRLLPKVGESGARRYEGGKARLKQRQGGKPVYVMAGWMRYLGAGRVIVENNDCGVGGAVDDDAIESEGVGDGVRGLGDGESLAGLCTTFVVGSKTRTLLPWGMSSERTFG